MWNDTIDFVDPLKPNSRTNLAWQSKLVLLLVLPFVAYEVVFAGRFYIQTLSHVAVWTLGLSALLGLIVLGLKAATPAGAATGAASSPITMIPAALADMAAVLKIEGTLVGVVAALGLTRLV